MPLLASPVPRPPARTRLTPSSGDAADSSACRAFARETSRSRRHVGPKPGDIGVEAPASPRQANESQL